MLLIAAIHIFRMGSHLPGVLRVLYANHGSDILLPFGGYFLLCAAEVRMPALRRSGAKLLLAFLIPAFAEVCQFFGIPLLGSTFDPLDFLAYGTGAALAAVIATQLFSRLFSFWKLDKSGI